MCERMGGYTGNKKPGLLGRVNSFYESGAFSAASRILA